MTATADKPHSSHKMSKAEIGENGFENQHQLRKRRGSFPQLGHEALSAEMLAPLPQANISRTPSSLFFNDDNENEPLLKVITNNRDSYFI